MACVQVDGSDLEVVDRFCYLGDMVDAGGGCELASIARINAAWGGVRTAPSDTHLS